MQLGWRSASAGRMTNLIFSSIRCSHGRSRAHGMNNCVNYELFSTCTGGGKADTANGSLPVEDAAPEQFLAQVLGWAEEYAASALPN
jgi:hypothetical protein